MITKNDLILDFIADEKNSYLDKTQSKLYTMKHDELKKYASAVLNDLTPEDKINYYFWMLKHGLFKPVARKNFKLFNKTIDQHFLIHRKRNFLSQELDPEKMSTHFSFTNIRLIKISFIYGSLKTPAALEYDTFVTRLQLISKINSIGGGGRPRASEHAERFEKYYKNDDLVNAAKETLEFTNYYTSETDSTFWGLAMVIILNGKAAQEIVDRIQETHSKDLGAATSFITFLHQLKGPVEEADRYIKNFYKEVPHKMLQEYQDNKFLRLYNKKSPIRYDLP